MSQKLEIKNQKRNDGYIALITVLLVSAVALVTSTTIGLLAIGEVQSAVALSEGDDTLSFVEGCMDDALLKARASDSYAGGSITRPEGTCTITVSKIGNVWTITATTIATQYKRTIQVRATKTTVMTIHSWIEI